MLGQRKKTHKEENLQKKKWELEFTEVEEEIKIDNDGTDLKEIPKQESEDERQSQNIDLSEKNQKGTYFQNLSF